MGADDKNGRGKMNMLEKHGQRQSVRGAHESAAAELAEAGINTGASAGAVLKRWLDCRESTLMFKVVKTLERW